MKKSLWIIQLHKNELKNFHFVTFELRISILIIQIIFR